MNPGPPPPPPAPDAPKREWRRWARAARPPALPADISEQVAARLAEWLPAAPPGWVVSFCAMPDEADLADLPRRTGRSFALTRTPPQGPLTLHRADGPLETHRFGFAQPAAQAPTVETSAVGVVLVPGLVFDRSGSRLGRGAGFYDGLLPQINPAAARVGVTTDQMVVERIPTDDRDAAMTHLATQSGVVQVAPA